MIASRQITLWQTQIMEILWVYARSQEWNLAIGPWGAPCHLSLEAQRKIEI